MQKYIITITPVMKNQPLPTIVLDVSADNFSVNYPKDVGIKVDSRNIQSHSELCVKMPQDERELHLWYDECLAEKSGSSRNHLNELVSSDI